MSTYSKTLLTSKEAAHRFGIADITLRTSRTTGKLFGVDAPKHIKLGRTIRYRAEELEAWLGQMEADTYKEGM